MSEFSFFRQILGFRGVTSARLLDENLRTYGKLRIGHFGIILLDGKDDDDDDADGRVVAYYIYEDDITYYDSQGFPPDDLVEKFLFCQHDEFGIRDSSLAFGGYHISPFKSVYQFLLLMISGHDFDEALELIK